MPYEFTFSKALEASHVIKDGAGVLHDVSVRLDSTAPNGTYYLQVFDAAKLPNNGETTAHMVCAPVKVVHTSGQDDELTINFDGTDNGGRTLQHGAVIALSTTEFTLTVGGAYLSIDASRA